MFLARMVMPRSRSSALESMTRSATRSLARKVPLCFSMASTSVVLPWSTWAMMAMLRMAVLKPGSQICAAKTYSAEPARSARRFWPALSNNHGDGGWKRSERWKTKAVRSVYRMKCPFPDGRHLAAPKIRAACVIPGKPYGRFAADRELPSSPDFAQSAKFALPGP